MALLTLTEKNTLATNNLFIGRIYQGLFNKANFWSNASLLRLPINLKEQKQMTFSKGLLNGQVSFDIAAIVRQWLANYNADVTGKLDANEQPIDSEILDTDALDIVYNNLAGVSYNDNQVDI